MCLTSAPVNGELRPLPSDATSPGCVEKLISVPTPASMLASPVPTSDERVPIDRARLRASGLSRQASRNSTLVLVARSMTRCMIIDAHHLQVEQRLQLGLGVDGHQVVAARHLQAVPGIEEHAGVGTRQSQSRSRAPCGRTLALSRSKPSMTAKPSFFSAAAMSAASFLGLASFGVCW